MQYFFDKVVRPYIIENGYKHICEIGAETGGNTDRLLGISSVDMIVVIDPCLDSDLHAKYKGNIRVKVLKGLSLDVLPNVPAGFDCMIIDGDHNWYTVYNELRIIESNGLLIPGGTIFLHDVCWPNGRRDVYYIPESIPQEFRHPYAKKGIERGRSELSPTAEFNSQYNNAAHEGGPRNGVLTAVLDFLEQRTGKYMFFMFDEEYGLGFLVKRGSLRTRSMCIKWLCLIRYYKASGILINFLKRRAPAAYSILSRIKNNFHCS